MLTFKFLRWQSEGDEPDYRFTLANERTFLAWIRTSLSFLVSGILLDQFVGGMWLISYIKRFISLGLIGLAAILCTVAYLRWRNNQIAMRQNAPLAKGVILPILTGYLVFISGLIGLLVLISKGV